MVQVLQRATDMCGHAEVEPGMSMNEALMDPKTRASAAKWRSGNETRKITALCARLMNGLQAIKPSWLEGLSDGQAEPPPVRPLPHSAIGPSAPPNRWVMIYNMAWRHVRWKTMGVVLLLICFPKIVALAISVMVRLVIRAMMALVGRMLSEVGRELRELLFQATLVTSSTEESLLHYMESLFETSHPPLMEPPQPTVSTATMSCPPPPAPHPNPPWSFFTCLLVVFQIFLQRLWPLGGAGGVPGTAQRPPPP